MTTPRTSHRPASLAAGARAALLVAFSLVAGCSLLIDDAIDHRGKDGGADIDGGGNACGAAACECSTSMDCGGHATCASDTNTCDCVAGYAGTGVTDCVWHSPIENAEFDGTSGWQVVGDAAIDPTAAGLTGAGVAKLDTNPGGCRVSQLRQTLLMPERSTAEPLVVEITARGEGFGGASFAELAIGWNGHFVRVPSFGSTWQTSRSCLGSAAYGGAVEFVVMTAGTACAPGNYAAIDSVRIVPTTPGECPGPSEIPNGDFESTDSWTPSITATGGSGTAVLLNSAGEGGTRGGQVGSTGGSASGTLKNIADYPMPPAAGGLALAFWWNASSGTSVNWASDEWVGSVSSTSGGAEFRRVCVPGWLTGVTAPLSMTVYGCPNGNCVATHDNLHFVEDPNCSADPFIADGHVEASYRLDYANHWRASYSGGSMGFAGAVGAGSPDSRSGTGALSMMVNSACDSPTLETMVRIPSPVGGQGPAVSVFARGTTAISHGVLSLMVDYNISAPATVVQGDWTETVMCLPADLSDKIVTLALRWSGTSGACSTDTTFSAEQLYVDDVRLLTSASCPVP